jgi:hypothetical protein
LIVPRPLVLAERRMQRSFARLPIRRVDLRALLDDELRQLPMPVEARAIQAEVVA